jgi:hypothetical protein
MTVDWFLSRVGVRCGGCNQRIAAASPMRRLRSGGLRCAPCTKALLGEAPPEFILVDAPLPFPKPNGNSTEQPLQPFVNLFRERLLGYPDVKKRAGGDR